MRTSHGSYHFVMHRFGFMLFCPSDINVDMTQAKKNCKNHNRDMIKWYDVMLNVLNVLQ